MNASSIIAFWTISLALICFTKACSKIKFFSWIFFFLSAAFTNNSASLDNLWFWVFANSTFLEDKDAILSESNFDSALDLEILATYNWFSTFDFSISKFAIFLFISVFSLAVNEVFTNCCSNCFCSVEILSILTSESVLVIVNGFWLSTSAIISSSPIAISPLLLFSLIWANSFSKAFVLFIWIGVGCILLFFKAKANSFS